MPDEDQPSRNGAPALRRGRSDDMHVVAGIDGWQIERSGRNDRALHYETQAQAVAAARNLARAKGGRITVHEPDGTVRDEVILGRLAFEQLSAVEGIHLTEPMRVDLRVLDDAGLSGGDRRRALVEKYGKASGS